MQLTCRFYKNKLPETDELVMVCITQIEEMGVDTGLLEYNNTKGMILLSEISRRRIRSINKLIRVGRKEVAVVLRVDADKGYIDLSKYRASPEDIVKCEEKFFRGKTVNSILYHTAEVTGVQTNLEFEELYEKTAWYYDEKYGKQGAVYDVFVRAANDEHELDDCQIDETTRKVLINNIRHHVSSQAVKYRADIEVACYGYEGIDAVKAALKEGLKASTEEMPIKINLIAPPLYAVTATFRDRTEGINALNNVIQKIKQTIEQYRGIFKIKMEPTMVTDANDRSPQDIIKDTQVSDDESDDSDSNEDEDNTDLQESWSTLRIENNVE
ncbi:unnamed protein product [Adineta steineri]|uniref:Eukaryotic translation initiation factor 2 subunit 1 n=1 Tax=Adineta steineri TaxID=433720 RepID=A0A814XHE5_9BILA|nr:unnamed protein product [Adineta steineri]CAF3681142.1 unnamed protein product [Adineta steineri]